MTWPHRPFVDEAFSSGAIGEGHAAVITESLTDLPANTPQEVQDQVERTLVAKARTCDPSKLRRIARGIRIETDPEGAEAAADRGFAGRRWRRWQDRDGNWHYDGILDPIGGEYLNTAVDALTVPDSPDTPPELRRSADQRNADAVVELARRSLDAGALPTVHRERPHITVVTTPESLAGAPGAPAAEAGWTGAITNATLRQIACDADITRVVLDGDSRPLDVGRASRTATRYQRRALIARDRACRGCGAPAPWCDAHHIRFWSDDGPTDIDNLVLLCRACHHKLHAGRWRLQRHPDNTVVLTMPSGNRITRPPP